MSTPALDMCVYTAMYMDHHCTQLCAEEVITSYRLHDPRMAIYQL